MDRPYLGRGRGRGRGRAGAWAQGPPQKNRQQQSPKKKQNHQNDNGSAVHMISAEKRFQDAATRHQQEAQRLLDEHTPVTEDNNVYDDSSDEENGDLNDEDIMNGLLKSYRHTNAKDDGDTVNDLGSTQEYLMNSLKSKANVCLICIESIKRNEPIWSCIGCYCMFHISCIQKWVKDGVYQQQSALSDDNFPAKDIPWHCPKCRYEYSQPECPSRYFCFCGKEEDPTFDAWTVPHSCGQMCSKKLKPECGHSCLLLCHPGPCPPCPQTVRSTCYCGQMAPIIRRCGAKAWSCGQSCLRPLSCRHHNCQQPCHAGECSTCKESSVQRCECGAEEQIRPCAQPTWQCKKVCRKPLSCGNHLCEKICHSGLCGDCPRSGKRSCPCGKSVFDLPCTEDVPTCVDTCGKKLECGKHECTQRCHTGPCGTCREMTVKTCRCGKKSKEIQCYKDYICETKCMNTKDCGRHSCKRKCCDGNCLPCDQQCNKNLGCNNHKCASRCHRGRCYPCTKTVSLSCNCGGTTITLPCGRERRTKPPKCNLYCTQPPDCHHPSRTPHRCHFGRCPPCRQTCERTMSCSHTCPSPCHSAVLTRVQPKFEREFPWEAAPPVVEELRDNPCPPCRVPTQVTCPGEHETVTLPCFDSAVKSCQRKCGRQLSCGNHTCQIPCHYVKDAPSTQAAGSNCEKCEEACSKTRPEGCKHLCLLACHPDDCPPCQMLVRMRCHCKVVLRHIECDTWTHADDTERDRLRSCNSQCPKHLTCGHQCILPCHSGNCPNPDRCTEKVKVRCACKRKKRDFLCNEVVTGYGKVECDEVCDQTKIQKKKEREDQEKAKKEEEEKKQQQELEEYKWKMAGKRRKKHRQKVEEEDPTFMQKYGMRVIGPVLAIILAVFMYYLFAS